MNAIPTLATLNSNIISNLESSLSITINPNGKSFINIFIGVLAGALYILYLFVAQLQKNIWVDTCDYATLIRFGQTILNRVPFPAVAGQYTITVTGTTGATIPSYQTFKSNDSSESPGMIFQIVGGSYVMPGASGTITVIALTGGTISRLAVADTITAISPIINVNSLGTVATESVIPIDAENYEDYRRKIITRIQTTAGSWNAGDYRINGETVIGVENIYAYTNTGTSNEVDVWVEGTGYGGEPRAASPTVVTAVATAINPLYPLGVKLVNYASSANDYVDITITMGGFAAYTAAQKAIIMTALENFVNSIKPFIAACDAIQNKNDTISAYNLYSTISQAVPGYGFSAVTFDINAVPTATYIADLGHVPYINSITYA